LASAGFLGAVVLVPVAVLLAAGIGEEQANGRLAGDLTDPVTLRALSNSVSQGLAGGFAAVLLGLPAGIALGRYRFRGRELVRGVLLVPFLLPTLVMVLALGAFLGPEGSLGSSVPAVRPLSTGFPGIVVVDALYNAPIVALLTAVGVESSGRALEETVEVLGAAGWQRFRDVWGRSALTGAAAGGVLAFALSALAFAAPITIGGPAQYTVEARIWSLAQQLADPAAASVVALLAVLLLAGPTVGYLLLLRRLPPRLDAQGWEGRRLRRDQPVGIVMVALLAGLLALEGVLLGTVVLRLAAQGSPRIGGGSALADLFSSGIAPYDGLPTAAALGNSAAFAAAASVLALLLGLAFAYALQERRSVARAPLAALPLGTLLISPVVLALAIARLGRPLVGGASGVWLLIIVSQAVLALPFVSQSLRVALARVPRRPREAAELLGAPPWMAFLEVDVAAARGGVFAAGLLAVALCLGEFTATYFLAVPRFTTGTVAMYRLAGARLFPEAWAMAALVMLISLAVLAATAWGGRRVAL
jgi:thiamine transport system permease protein